MTHIESWVTVSIIGTLQPGTLHITLVVRGCVHSVLWSLGMTITHRGCLELLAERPGLSNSKLACAAFVTRQPMNVFLQPSNAKGS